MADPHGKTRRQQQEQQSPAAKEFRTSHKKEAIENLKVTNYLEEEDSFAGTACRVGGNENLITVSSLTANQRQIIDRLELLDWFPDKISLLDVMALRDEHESTLGGNQSTAFRVLKAIVMTDYNSVRKLLKISTIKEPEADSKKSSEAKKGWSSDEDDCPEFVQGCESPLFPSDVLLACYLCCDARLKQILAEKLFDCKMAVPLAWSSECVTQLLIWPLKSRVLQFKNRHKESVRKHVNFDQFQIASALRLGACTVSKSELINKCLDEKHLTFSEPSAKRNERILSAGSIEQAWLFPNQEETDHLKLDNALCVLNMRGDATKHEPQRRFLAEISTCLIVLLQDESSDTTPVKDIYDCLLEMFQINKNLILVISSKKIPNYLKHIGREFQNNVTLLREAAAMKLPELVDEVKKRLNENLRKSAQSDKKICRVMESAAQSAGWQVDELTEGMSQIKRDVELMVSTARRSSPLELQTLFPLQGDPWKEIAKVVRKTARNIMNSTSLEKVHLQKEENTVTRMNRDTQLNFMLKELKKTDGFVKVILKRLYQSSSHSPDITAIVFLQSLRISIDAENCLSCAGVGVEHILREVSQVYEAIMSREQLAQENGEFLERQKNYAAHLLLKGYPLELMDGDAGCIPTKWIGDLMIKLNEIVGQKNSLLVVSVLGIQSSGKSTLLNTMFGLQMAVSSGRCTKGAYMQLVRNDEKKSKLPVDFVVIIDTEGLRSIELGDGGGRSRDNELATLAIGLADVTIMNIMGENLADISDVLQVVVHAFLRMRAASECLSQKKSCLFVHQNVSATDFDQKNQAARDRLLETLDTTAKVAAAEEGIEKVERFNDLISFDVNNSVFFLPNLWEGELPRAPVSHGYSRNVQVIKGRVLDCLLTAKEQKLNFEQFSTRINDMWKAILNENFVFSFRNTLEINAHREVSKFFVEKNKELEMEMYRYITKEQLPKLRACSEATELSQLLTDLNRETKTKVKNLEEKIRKSFEDFFQRNEGNHIIVQWKAQTLLKFESNVEKFISDYECRLREVKEEQRVALQSKQRANNYKGRVLEKTRELAASVDSGMTASKLEDKFNELWEKEMSDLTLTEKTKIDFQQEAERALQKNPERNKIIRVFIEYLSELKIDFMNPDQTLRNSMVKYMRMREEVKFYVKESTLLKIADKIRSSTEEPFEEQTLTMAELIFDAVKKQEISHLVSEEESMVSSVVFDRIIERVDKECAKFMQQKYVGVNKRLVVLQPQFNDFLQVFSCFHAAAIFNDYQEKLEGKSGVKAQLLQFRMTAWQEFQSSYRRESEDQSNARLIANLLGETVRAAALRDAANKVVDELMEQNEYSDPMQIIKDIMKSLVDDRNFSNFMKFIASSRGFAEEWLEEKVNVLFFRTAPGGPSRYTKFFSTAIEAAKETIKFNIREATLKTLSVKNEQCRIGLLQFWIQEFSKNYGEMNKNDFRLANGRSVSDIENFSKTLSERLDSIEKEIHKNAPKSLKEVNWDGSAPHIILLQKMWDKNCADCPLCGEPAIGPDSVKADWKHISLGPQQTLTQTCERFVCRSDRPLCIKGILADLRLLTMDCCGSQKVLKDRTEYLKDKDTGRWWARRMETPSPYWIWFVCSFKRDLECKYQAKIEGIPEEWLKVDSDDAKQWLDSEDKDKRTVRNDGGCSLL